MMWRAELAAERGSQPGRSCLGRRLSSGPAGWLACLLGAEEPAASGAAQQGAAAAALRSQHLHHWRWRRHVLPARPGLAPSTALDTFRIGEHPAFSLFCFFIAFMALFLMPAYQWAPKLECRHPAASEVLAGALEQPSGSGLYPGVLCRLHFCRIGWATQAGGDHTFPRSCRQQGAPGSSAVRDHSGGPAGDGAANSTAFYQRL